MYAARAHEAMALGRELELSGKDLAEFVTKMMAEQEKQEAERAELQLRQEKLAQEERLARERMEHEREDRERERELRRERDSRKHLLPVLTSTE